MKKAIMVIDADKKQRRKLCKLLEERQFDAIEVDSSRNLNQLIKDTACRAIFWDIDTVPVDNRIIRDFNTKFPDVYFFCLSCQPIHPELSDAISRHIYACLNRPIDPDELFYWLKSIDENALGLDNSATS